MRPVFHFHVHIDWIIHFVQKKKQLAPMRNFLVSYTSATSLLCYTATRTCFSAHIRCCQSWWITEATEVSVRLLWRIPPASETQTRVWVDAKRTCCGRCEARILSALSFSWTLLDALTHRALSISLIIKSERNTRGLDFGASGGQFLPKQGVGHEPGLRTRTSESTAASWRSTARRWDAKDETTK